MGMRFYKILAGLLLTALSMLLYCATQNGFPDLEGPYLGQQLPGKIPEYFAPGIVTTRYHEHSAPSISPAGDEIFWSVFLGPLQSGAPQVILFSRLHNGKWTPPEVAPFSGQYMEGGACYTADGNRLYYGSCRPLDGNDEPKDWDIWYVERTLDSWSEPRNPGPPLNSPKNESQPSITGDGTLYFLSDHPDYQYENCIFRSRLGDGLYENPEPLGEPINVRGSYAWCPFIAPDESYLLFASEREGGLGWGDIYISFRRDNDTWTEPKNLGRPICSEDNDRFPAVSPDGKVLFFASKRTRFGSYYTDKQTLAMLMDRYAGPGNGLTDIYWVDAGIIEDFR